MGTYDQVGANKADVSGLQRLGQLRDVTVGTDTRCSSIQFRSMPSQTLSESVQRPS